MAFGAKRRGRSGGQRGSVSIEFIGLIPALILVTLIAGQGVITGYSLWSAAISARAAARATHVGTSPQTAGMRALPTLLRADARVTSLASSVVEVAVYVPRLIPVLPRYRVRAATSMEAGGG